jgi:hypothetical protein
MAILRACTFIEDRFLPAFLSQLMGTPAAQI